jgi:hypothetical protein
MLHAALHRKAKPNPMHYLTAAVVSAVAPLALVAVAVSAAPVSVVYEQWRARSDEAALERVLQADRGPYSAARQQQADLKAFEQRWLAQHPEYSKPPVQPKAALSAQLVATAPASPNEILPMRKPSPSPCAVEFFLPEVMFSTLSPAEITQRVHTACPAS